MALPVTPPETAHLGDWVIARSFEEAVAHVEERGMPSFISFDHDLGTGKSGKDFANWLVDRDLDHPSIPDCFGFEVHSGNPVGRRNIRDLLDAYLAARRDTAVADRNLG